MVTVGGAAGLATVAEVAAIEAGAAVPPLVIGSTLPSGPMDCANPQADIRIPRLKTSTTGMRFMRHLSTHQFSGRATTLPSLCHLVHGFLPSSAAARHQKQALA